MGRSYTPTYRVEFDVQPAGMTYTPSGWDSREHGRPSAAALERYVRTLNASVLRGGVNYDPAAKMIPRVWSARIVRQSTGEVVANWKAAPFEVMGLGQADQGDIWIRRRRGRWSADTVRDGDLLRRCNVPQYWGDAQYDDVLAKVASCGFNFAVDLEKAAADADKYP